MKIIQDVNQDLGLFVHDQHEIVENVEVEGWRDESSSSVPFAATTIRQENFNLQLANMFLFRFQLALLKDLDSARAIGSCTPKICRLSSSCSQQPV